jgi:protein O-GlcNAc transferase
VKSALQKQQAGDIAAATGLYRQAVAQDPNHAMAHHLLGVCLFYQADHAEARAAISRAVALKPDYAEAWSNLGVVLYELSALAEAEAAYRQAVTLKPDYVEAWSNLGNTLRDRGRPAEAEAACRTAIGLRASFAEAHLNLGTTLRDLGRAGEAAAEFAAAVELNPNYADAHANLGTCFLDDGRMDEAMASLGRAIALRPANMMARWQLVMTNLPIIYRSEAEIDERRAAYRDALENLARDCRLDDRNSVAQAAKAVGSAQPFFLAYQGRSDRALQALHGTLAARIMAAHLPAYAERPPMPDRPLATPIRVGILSGFFHGHSNWKIPIRGWAEHLARDRFELFGYYTQTKIDRNTSDARRSFAKFVEGPMSVEAWCATIRADRLHILIIPETGMDPTTLKLAALRLAPVQATSWGHPNTSGLPTIDYFLSSDLMEPPDGQRHYTETLVRLPNLGIFYTPREPPQAAVTRAELGFSEAHVLYWSCQSLFKYLPRYDWIFPAIAADVPDARFLFIAHASAAVNAIFRDRLDRAFADRGLVAERHCVFHERVDFERFAALSAMCDVFLDSPGWSGCNSVLEGIATDLPVATHRGELMRARHSAAIFEMMGLGEPVTDTVEDFVAIAIRMGRDAEFRHFLRERIGRMKPAIYQDKAAVLGLEDFIQRAVATSC